MSMHAEGTIEMKTWDEQAYAEHEDAPKMARAIGQDLYYGMIEGEATFEYIMVYSADGNEATYVGMERLVGRVGDRSGSFVLQVSGTYGADGVKATITIMTGSGTGELRGLRGDGQLQWKDAQQSAVALDYDFA